MNLVNSIPRNHETEVTLLLEPQTSGRFIASVMELPGCRVEADTRAAAIVLVQSQLQEYLKQVELIRVALPSEFEARKPDPWDKLFGVFKDDPDFAEIAAEIRASRDVDDDSEVDPAVYES
jgi:predicted RNase H-like HicB family nuclease